MDLRDKIYGGTWALITGDALGVPVEFQDRWQLKENPVTDMRAFGSHNQPAGTWSDDSSMMLGAMDSLSKGYDPEDIMRHFALWMKEGQYTPWGNVFDIGNTCRKAIKVWDMCDVPAILCGGTSDDSNGNGSLMWCLPVCYYAYVQEKCEEFSFTQSVALVMEASGITHHHLVSRVGCGLYYFLIREMLNQTYSSDQEILKKASDDFYSKTSRSGNSPVDNHERPHLSEVISIGLHHGFAFFDKDPDQYDEALSRYSRLRLTDEFANLPENKIQSTGYIVHTLEAAVWCLLNSNNLKESLLKAMNLGNDTDTIGAVTGGLAGTWYGYDAIPGDWLSVLARRKWINDICSRFTDSLTGQLNDETS